MLETWKSLGFDVIPLLPNTKDAFITGWQEKGPKKQWEEARGKNPSAKFNLGIRLGSDLSGGKVAVVDCDNKSSVRAVGDKFNSMGLHQSLRILTPRGGLHYYLRISEPPKDRHSFNLDKSVGKGEFRFGCGSQVATVDSTINDKRYLFFGGFNPETFLRQPVIDFDDLLWLIPEIKTAKTKVSKLPVPLLEIDIPKRVDVLLDALSRGEVPKKYKESRRSGIEAAITDCLILAGWDYHSIKTFFDKNVLPLNSHYRDYPDRHRSNYLRLTYINVLGDLTSSPQRKEIADYYVDIQNDNSFKKENDKNVFKGLLSVGWKWNSWTPSASERYLSQLSNIPPSTLRRSLRRLQEQGRITLFLKAKFGDKKGSTYRINKVVQ